MKASEIKTLINSHLSAKCEEHGEKLLEICPVENCPKRLMCRVCKKDHQKDHLAYTYYLKEIFEDGLGIFAALNQKSEQNSQIKDQLKVEIGVRVDIIRTKFEEAITKLEEDIYNSLENRIPLI